MEELTLCVVKKSLRGKFESSVESLVSQLVQKEGEGFLVARVFFDFDDAQDDANEINYKKVYIQPGVVTIPDSERPAKLFEVRVATLCLCRWGRINSLRKSVPVSVSRQPPYLFPQLGCL